MFGDFNVDTLIDDNEKHQYTNMLAAYRFVVQNISPTRVTSATDTCLDLIISSYPIETETLNKPGTAQVCAISKAQKQQKDFKVSSTFLYSTQKKFSKLF